MIKKAEQLKFGGKFAISHAPNPPVVKTCICVSFCLIELLNVFVFVFCILYFALNFSFSQCAMGLPSHWIAQCICVCILYLYLCMYFVFVCVFCICVVSVFAVYLCNRFDWTVNCSMSQRSRPTGCSSTHLAQLQLSVSFRSFCISICTFVCISISVCICYCFPPSWPFFACAKCSVFVETVPTELL